LNVDHWQFIDKLQIGQFRGNVQCSSRIEVIAPAQTGAIVAFGDSITDVRSPASIRTSNAYDAVLDFDKAVRDPDKPTKLLPRFDPGDHLHLNATGYEAVANAIDIRLFRVSGGATRR
jgi:lysophospholipase L1-like esterase